MSNSYSIEIKLDALYDKENISEILERGIRKGFIYYDHEAGVRYLNAPILNASSAAEKVIKDLNEKSEYGPNVYALIEPENSAHLYFYETEGSIEFHVGVFSYPRKKGYYIDFDHYIRMFLDIVEDFPILELKTNMF